MKKVLLIISVAGLLTACGNNETSEEKTTKETGDTIRSADPDTSKMMTDPAHSMAPHDTTGRRPRD